MDSNKRIRFILPLNGFDNLVNKLANIIESDFKPEKLHSITDGKKMANTIINSS